jgi:hypothetical protein
MARSRRPTLASVVAVVFGFAGVIEVEVEVEVVGVTGSCWSRLAQSVVAPVPAGSACTDGRTRS